MKPPRENCMCSDALSNGISPLQNAKEEQSTGDETKEKSTHDVIREHLYKKAGITKPRCCALCAAFAAEQARAHIEWDD